MFDYAHDENISTVTSHTSDNNEISATNKRNIFIVQFLNRHK